MNCQRDFYKALNRTVSLISITITCISLNYACHEYRIHQDLLLSSSKLCICCVTVLPRFAVARSIDQQDGVPYGRLPTSPYSARYSCWPPVRSRTMSLTVNTLAIRASNRHRGYIAAHETYLFELFDLIHSRAVTTSSDDAPISSVRSTSW